MEKQHKSKYTELEPRTQKSEATIQLHELSKKEKVVKYV